MHDDRHLLRDLIEHVARVTMMVDKVFADDFKPGHTWAMFQDMLEMTMAQAHTQPQIREAKAWAERHWRHQVDGGRAMRNVVGAGILSFTGVPRLAITVQYASQAFS